MKRGMEKGPGADPLVRVCGCLGANRGLTVITNSQFHKQIARQRSSATAEGPRDALNSCDVSRGMGVRKV